MERVATDWDKYYKRIRISQRFLWMVWMAYVNLLKGFSFSRPIKIAELGCGTGYHTLQMTKMYPTTKVTMIDANQCVIQDTERRMSCLQCKKEFLLADLFNLELQDKYDIVHSQGLLEHYTPEKQRQLIRLHRDLLAPDGIAVILVPTPSLTYRFWRGLLEKLNQWIYTDENPLSREEFTRQLEDSGLEILKIQGCHLIEVGAVCRKK
jgi:trans-aconitate methyltransferase